MKIKQDIFHSTISLACQCSTCGQWNAVNTKKLDVCKFHCKKCGKHNKLRSKIHGWNVNVRIIESNECQSDIISKLNGLNLKHTPRIKT
jgi:hypothetical protein